MTIEPDAMMTSSIHIVRQYGTVGGMERYVWELTHALANQGQKVMVVCEKIHEPLHANIEVIELGVVKPKPRWLAMLRFSNRVTKFFASFNSSNWVIHSHERTAVHQVTTFHGPPFLKRNIKALDFLSPRIKTWEYLEKRELCADNVKRILPNSLPVAEQLKNYYPTAACKIEAPAYPGVDPMLSKLKKSSDGNTVGFIGKEWKRKGLDFACQVVTKLRGINPNVKFIVAGPDPSDVAHLFKGWPSSSFELLGWSRAEEVLPRIDVLIHPARVEPFGMVMAEANAAGIPIIISDQCGISPLIDLNSGRVLPLANAAIWIEQIHSLMQDKPNIRNLNLTWDDLARQHQQLYQQIISER